jgi:hypothetical protein
MQKETKNKQELLYSYEKEKTLNKKLKRDKESHHVLIKESIQQEDIKIIRIWQHGTNQTYEVNIIEFKGRDRFNTIIVGDFNIPLSCMDRSFRQEINEEITDLNYTLEKLDLIDIEYFTQWEQTTHSSHQHLELSPG